MKKHVTKYIPLTSTDNAQKGGRKKVHTYLILPLLHSSVSNHNQFTYIPKHRYVAYVQIIGSCNTIMTTKPCHSSIIIRPIIISHRPPVFVVQGSFFPLSSPSSPVNCHYM